MTTVAYKDNVIAFDSLYTANGLITESNGNKKITVNGVTFVFAGAQSDQGEIVKAYFNEPYSLKADMSALIDDNGTVYRAAICNDDGFWKINISGKIYAIGCGRDHAFTAMDLGLTAAEAVKMAAKRDVYTGGRIRMHRVKKSAL